MTEAETAVRNALAKMTPGQWRAEKGHAGWYVLDDEGLIADDLCKRDAAGIVALKNHTPALLAELDAARAEVARLKRALAWYAEQVKLCSLAHSGGDAGRHALQADGGQRARAALEASHD